MLLRFPVSTTFLPLAGLALLGSLQGCKYDEGLTIKDFTGTVVVPKASATRTFTHVDETTGEVTTETITDVRLIGPVYLGVFPSVENGLFSHPHPEEGPAFQEGIPGDTYPYGGTSLGDMNFPCMQPLVCKVVSGRFLSFDDIVDWFDNKLQAPIVDALGQHVTNGADIEQTCFDELHYTSDAEIRLTATDDVNEDGKIDGQDLQFVENADGDFEAPFDLRQQEYFQNEDGSAGFTLWGWMDAASTVSNLYSSCDLSQGLQEVLYNQSFYGGRTYRDLLNHPSLYIATGDYTTNGYQYKSADDEPPTLTLDVPVVQ